VPPAKALLLILLFIVAFDFTARWMLSLGRRNHWPWPNSFQYLVGIVTNFFDTLGIGSFATTAAFYRWQGTVVDEKLPGTLNIGHCLPTVVQALIYVTIVEVDQRTLGLLIATAVLGAWVGAGIVTGLSRRSIRLGMGGALLLASAILLARLCNLLPSGGDSLALFGPWLVAAMLGNFALGALMMIGVGAYAPIMIMVSLLGMNPKAAFPIMMGSCAFLVPIGSTRFIRTGMYDVPAALGLTLGGIPAVLIAALIIKELPLDAVRWLVLGIVFYTAISLLRAARVN